MSATELGMQHFVIHVALQKVAVGLRPISHMTNVHQLQSFQPFLTCPHLFPQSLREEHHLSYPLFQQTHLAAAHAITLTSKI